MVTTEAGTEDTEADLPGTEDIEAGPEEDTERAALLHAFKNLKWHCFEFDCQKILLNHLKEFP